MNAFLDKINQHWLHWLEKAADYSLIGLRVVLIITVAWIVMTVLRKLILTIPKKLHSNIQDADTIKRADTLARVLRYVVTVVIWAMTLMLVLSEFGISLAPILGAAGVVGLAVGFGAQSLVRDYVTGFFLLLENQIRAGDIVQLGNLGGEVENVTLRYVQLRDYAGDVHYIPNGQITTVTNRSRGFGNAVIDVGVGYGENIDHVMSVMKDVATELRQDDKFSSDILADLEIAGVENWADSAVMIRGRFRCVAQKQWTVRREYLKRLKAAFDAQGIEIPYPHVTYYKADSKPKAVTTTDNKTR